MDTTDPIPSPTSAVATVAAPASSTVRSDPALLASQPCEQCGKPQSLPVGSRFLCLACATFAAYSRGLDVDRGWLRRHRVWFAVPSDEAAGAELVGADEGGLIDPRYQGWRVSALLVPPAALPAGPAEPWIVELPGLAEPRAVLRLRVWPKGIDGWFVERWDPHHGVLLDMEGCRTRGDMERVLDDLRRRPARGRPRGSGGSFRDTDEFLGAVRAAVAGLRRQHRSPTKEAVAAFFAQRKDFPVCSQKSLSRWTTRSGYASWHDLVQDD